MRLDEWPDAPRGGADAVAAYVPWFYPAGEADVRTHFLGLLEAGAIDRTVRPVVATNQLLLELVLCLADRAFVEQPALLEGTDTAVDAIVALQIVVRTEEEAIAAGAVRGDAVGGPGELAAGLDDLHADVLAAGEDDALGGQALAGADFDVYPRAIHALVA